MCTRLVRRSSRHFVVALLRRQRLDRPHCPPVSASSLAVAGEDVVAGRIAEGQGAQRASPSRLLAQLWTRTLGEAAEGVPPMGGRAYPVLLGKFGPRLRSPAKQSATASMPPEGATR
jgi:hypothetical protein